MTNLSSIPLVSIIIPARNEENDIVRTLDACINIDYEPKEIIVVDDSTDSTPRIVGRYAARGVRLIHRDQNTNGCCGARNLGMQQASGEIIVLLNADDVPSSDFLQRLVPHYRDGTDWVLIDSRVLNCDNMWARYISAEHLAKMNWRQEKSSRFAWSEGFSCRRSAAHAVGYIPGDFPIPFCRDYMLGLQLEVAGFTRTVDLSIIMDHVSPSSFSEYWRNQVWRASFSAPFRYYLKSVPFYKIVLIEFLKSVRWLLVLILALPLLWRSGIYVKHSGGVKYFPEMLIVGIIHDAARVAGSWQGLRRLTKAVFMESLGVGEPDLALNREDLTEN